MTCEFKKPLILLADREFNSIKDLSPYKTMNQGTTDEKGNFRYIKRLFKKVQAKPKMEVA